MPSGLLPRAARHLCCIRPGTSAPSCRRASGGPPGYLATTELLPLEPDTLPACVLASILPFLTAFAALTNLPLPLGRNIYLLPVTAGEPTLLYRGVRHLRTQRYLTRGNASRAKILARRPTTDGRTELPLNARAHGDTYLAGDHASRCARRIRDCDYQTRIDALRGLEGGTLRERPRALVTTRYAAHTLLRACTAGRVGAAGTIASLDISNSSTLPLCDARLPGRASGVTRA